MKKFLALITLLSVNAFAQTHVDLSGGTSATIRAGEDVVVTCTASAVSCQITLSNGYYYLKQGGNTISNFYTDASKVAVVLKQYRADGICQ